jgi:hypothetical protein
MKNIFCLFLMFSLVGFPEEVSHLKPRRTEAPSPYLKLELVSSTENEAIKEYVKNFLEKDLEAAQIFAKAALGSQVPNFDFSRCHLVIEVKDVSDIRYSSGFTTAHNLPDTKIVQESLKTGKELSPPTECTGKIRLEVTKDVKKWSADAFRSFLLHEFGHYIHMNFLEKYSKANSEMYENAVTKTALLGLLDPSKNSQGIGTVASKALEKITLREYAYGAITQKYGEFFADVFALLATQQSLPELMSRDFSKVSEKPLSPNEVVSDRQGHYYFNPARAKLWKESLQTNIHDPAFRKRFLLATAFAMKDEIDRYYFLANAENESQWTLKRVDRSALVRDNATLNEAFVRAILTNLKALSN